MKQENTRYCVDVINRKDTFVKEKGTRKPKRRQLNRYARKMNHKKRLIRLYEECPYYPCPVDCIEPDSFFHANIKKYYVRRYKGKRWTNLKKISNKKVRRYNKDIQNGSAYKKIYDVWWEFC